MVQLLFSALQGSDLIRLAEPRDDWKLSRSLINARSWFRLGSSSRSDSGIMTIGRERRYRGLPSGSWICLRLSYRVPWPVTAGWSCSPEA